jgi:hypothetical protein
LKSTGRFEWIRTTDLTVIGRLLYRAELRSEMEHGAARRDRAANLTLGVPCRLSDRSECLMEWTVRFELTKTWVAARRLRPLGHVHGSTNWQRAPVPTRKPVGSKRLAGAAHPRWGYPLCLAESGGHDPQPFPRSHRFRGGPGPCPVHSPENDRGRGTRNPIAHAIDLCSKQSRALPDSPSIYVAPPAGFDPAASCLTNKRSPD